MAITNELNSEIVAAIFSLKERSPEELNDLKNMLLEVHSTLQSLEENARRDREDTPRAAKAASNEP